MTRFSWLKVGEWFRWGPAVPGLTPPPGGPFLKVSARRYRDPEGRTWSTGMLTAVERCPAPAQPC